MGESEGSLHPPQIMRYRSVQRRFGNQDRGDHVCARWPATNDVYCMGGFTEIDGNFTILSSVEKFDMSTEEWEARADMVQPRADFAVG